MKTPSLFQRLVSCITSRFIAVCFVVAASPLPAQRSEIVFPAADLASAEQAADSPAPGKWWLNRNAQGWGVTATDEVTVDGARPLQRVTLKVPAAPSDEELEQGR